MNDVVQAAVTVARPSIEIMVDLRYCTRGSGVTATLALSKQLWGEVGLKQKISDFNVFNLKREQELSKSSFFKAFIKLVQDNKESHIRLAANKYLLDEVPKYGFCMDFLPSDFEKQGTAVHQFTHYIIGVLEGS